MNAETMILPNKGRMRHRVSGSSTLCGLDAEFMIPARKRKNGEDKPLCVLCKKAGATLVLKPVQIPARAPIFPSCGCTYAPNDNGITFCALHAEASALLNALQELLRDSNNLLIRKQAFVAISAARRTW